MLKASSEQRDLMIQQLIEGIEAARQLQKRILIGPSKTDHHGYDYDNPQLEEDDQALNQSLLDKMLASFDKTISIAKLLRLELQHHHDDHDHQQPSNNSQYEGSPPHSLALSSPRSDNTHHHLHVAKKRKMMPRCSVKVKAEGGTGLEGPLDDGYTWRKYGQKDILGAKHPRCTHRHTRGCGATKQVQRTDEDPTIFHVIYRGEHTCFPVPHFSQAQSKPNKQTQVKIEPKPQQPPSPQAQPQMAYSPEPEVYLGLDPDGALKVEPYETESPAHFVRSFSFTPALLEPGPMDNFLSDFGSPATSESNYFPVTGLNVQTSESDLNGSVSGPNSVSNSPMGWDFEFPIDQLLDIGADFPDFEFEFLTNC
ncbi:hypothetical protein Cgig2_030401 [Carnegiea gigantea]|uniref:WRKY domain-containing protein n=1 Tax=Carnegiea gigantea TaxID=171969 RepID=A0A9Q1KK53_9CARY|nr:hypothetical protein Cgig2_030401 [Carnegiea gigantea]